MKRTRLVPAIGLSILIYAGCLQHSSTKSYDMEAALTGVYQSPDTASIDPSVEQVVHFRNGMSVEVPADAFVDAAGNAVKTPVKISVTRYDTKAKILASGIPMKYSENGEEHDFESAGMFDIEGYSGANKVQIAKNKKLAVNMPSKCRGNYDFYYLEEHEGKKVTAAGFGGSEGGNSKRQGTWRKLSPDSTRDKYDTSKTLKNFSLKFDSKDYPALAELNAINWHLATSFQDPTSADNSWVLNTEWSSLDITQPAYILGEAVHKFSFTDLFDTAGKSVTDYDEMELCPDRETIAIFNRKNTSVTIWSAKEQKAITIDNAELEHPSFIDSERLMIRKGERTCLYNKQGRMILDYGRAFGFLFCDKKDRVVYEYDCNASTGSGSIRIADLAGHLIKEFKLYEKDPDAFYPVSRTFVMTNDNLLAIRSVDSICLYTLDGQLVKSKAGAFSWCEVLGEHMLLCEKKDGGLLAWNYETAEMTESATEQINTNPKVFGNTEYWGHTIPGPAPFVIIDEPSKNFRAPSKLWNYKTNEVTIPGFHAVAFPGPAGVLLGNSRTDSNRFCIYDAAGQRKLIDVNCVYAFTDGGFMPEYSAKWKRFMIGFPNCVQLYTKDGTLVRDFRKYDTLITNGGLADSNTIFTYSRNGIYRLWSMDGRLLKVITTDGGAYSYGFEYGGWLVAWDDIFRTYKVYDMKGNAVADLGRAPRALLGKNKFAVMANDGKGEILPYVPRQKYIYQLTLRTSKQEFRTYVYLDAETAQRLARYTGFRTMKLKEEVERKASEELVLRRFEIDKFGIYNWDALLFNKNNVIFAATFKFDVPVEYNNITVFCLSKFDGDIVIKFYQDLWNKFYIDPTRSNKLVAVLPGNKIAVFSEEDMKKIDWEQVIRTGTFTFNMKTVDQPIDNIEKLNQFL